MENKINLLLDIWENITGTQIGPDDNFFAYGTDSVTLARFTEEIMEKTEAEINASDLFYYTTIAEIAQSIWE